MTISIAERTRKNPAVTANIPKLDMLCAVFSASPIIAYGILFKDLSLHQFNVMVYGICLRLFFKGGVEVRQGHLIRVVLIP